MATAPNPTGFILHGTLIDAPTPHALRIREGAFCVVGADGVIAQICSAETELRDEYGMMPMTLLPQTQMVVPGLIDLHIHAPQFKQLGTKTDIPLMEWLEKYTYPAEIAFASTVHASSIYPKLVAHLLKNGTTTAVLFGSNHLAATQVLAEACAAAGLRALVGKTCADTLTPAEYIESTEGSLRETEEFVQWCNERWGGGPTAIVRPVVTPRFIPTCTKELLAGLGEIAQRYDCFVQSHAAESVDEEALVEMQHPGSRDVAIFRDAGLLGSKTILAHCCRLRDAEARDMEQAGAAVVSCPFSNILFARATVPIPRYLHDFPALKIGMGTDIAGGFGTMLDNMRIAILQDRIDSFAAVARADTTAGAAGETPPPANWMVDFKYAFHLATASGARALGLEDVVGKFEDGMRFDALLLDCDLGDGQRFTRFGDEGVGELFEKWVTTGDDRNVLRVWVDGKLVRGA
ncbi:hypothetical protein DRE_01786 [Drechslerella stenobrocha 248]|uniref:Amidohydrolase-related domain-containing protein n=1 Tax=Drechslerella stenobrocha 248 TaxID=1043628 RepID=W7HYI4_9PEZI|nr:hypothetical protein DRE_01786 [Drechslerella stenobrocha 248]